MCSYQTYIELRKFSRLDGFETHIISSLHILAFISGCGHKSHGVLHEVFWKIIDILAALARLIWDIWIALLPCSPCWLETKISDSEFRDLCLMHMNEPDVNQMSDVDKKRR